MDNSNPGVNPQQESLAKDNLEKLGEHALTTGEVALFGEIYATFDRLRTLTAMFLCDKYGYPEKEPIGFEFNWQNRTVAALRPRNSEATPPSNFEVTGDAPSAPVAH